MCVASQYPLNAGPFAYRPILPLSITQMPTAQLCRLRCTMKEHPFDVQGRLRLIRQNKLPSAIVLTPEEGLASECQTVLRVLGLKKISHVYDEQQLRSQLLLQPFDIILIDTDCLEDLEERGAGAIEVLKATNNQQKGIFVALSHVDSRDELLKIRTLGFVSVLIKPISTGMMQQALSEVIERFLSEPIDRQSLKRIHAQFMQGQTFEAERILQIWLDKESESLEGLTLLALHQLKKQEFYKANQTVQQILTLNSNYLPALQLRAKVCLRLGQLNEAFQALSREEKVVGLLDAKKASTLNHILNAQERAEFSFCDEFGTREGMSALLINLGLQLSKTGKYAEAVELYRRALGPLEDDQSKYVALFNRGRLYLNQQLLDEAERDFLLAQHIAPHELREKIIELIAKCQSLRSKPATLSTTAVTARTGAASKIQSHQKSTPDPAKESQEVLDKRYQPFDRDEVLKLVFLGKMQEDSVPPESVNEWLQIKKQLLHVLFLEDLPISPSISDTPDIPMQQESP